MSLNNNEEKNNKKQLIVISVCLTIILVILTTMFLLKINEIAKKDNKTKEEEGYAYTQLITSINEGSVEKIEMSEGSKTAKVKLVNEVNDHEQIILKNTEDAVINSSDWRDVYRALSSDDKNKDITEVVKEISTLDFVGASSNMERLQKYKDFVMILKKVPIIKKILRLYTANILSPDDISKVSLKTVPRNAIINKGTEEYVSIENKYKIILDKINLEDQLYDLVFKTLFYGDIY